MGKLKHVKNLIDILIISINTVLRIIHTYRKKETEKPCLFSTSRKRKKNTRIAINQHAIKKKKEKRREKEHARIFPNAKPQIDRSKTSKRSKKDYSVGIRENITISRPIEIKASVRKSQIYAHPHGMGLRRAADSMISVSSNDDFHASRAVVVHFLSLSSPLSPPVALTRLGFRTRRSQYGMMNYVD